MVLPCILSPLVSSSNCKVNLLFNVILVDSCTQEIPVRKSLFFLKRMQTYSHKTGKASRSGLLNPKDCWAQTDEVNELEGKGRQQEVRSPTPNGRDRSAGWVLPCLIIKPTEHWKCGKLKKDVLSIKYTYRDFPGGPAAKTALPLQGALVRSLATELDPACNN